jgi:methionyl-tRNA synthetase
MRVNAELVNNLGNLANRTLALLAADDMGKKLAPPSPGDGRKLVEQTLARVPDIRAAFERWDYRGGMKVILELGHAANQFLTVHAPWKLKKTDLEAARGVLSDAAEVVYVLAALLKPVVPKLADKLFTQLNAPELDYAGLEKAQYPLLKRDQAIGDPSPLINRMEETDVSTLIQAPVPAAVISNTPAAAAVPAAATPSAEIEYADFAKVTLKVGKVLAAEKVAKADKLLKLTVEVGEPAPRTIVSGIAEAYAAEAVVGKNVVVVMNLKPRMLKGIESKGMLLTAGPGGKDLVLLDPGATAAGAEVK